MAEHGNDSRKVLQWASIWTARPQRVNRSHRGPLGRSAAGERPVTLRLLLLSLSLAATPVLAQAGEARAWDSRAGTWVTWGTMADSLARHDVVVVGEQHDDPATHRAEASLLDAIGRRRARVLVSLEMFERDVQPLLDDYGVGRVSEAAFLARARPWRNYASDYRPLVEHARARRWPVVAANVPRPLASAVARGGMAVLDTLAQA
ncbi:MAG: ChaN family lipoprotein, partial [Gemmatimonadetes bacterium]|nr:ChaN family lipoprotein [Gemmatimonadota bacterium]